jgi:hypothetical protein
MAFRYILAYLCVSLVATLVVRAIMEGRWPFRRARGVKGTRLGQTDPKTLDSWSLRRMFRGRRRGA